MAQLEFFYDYGSPFSFLANSIAPGIAEAHGLELVYRPMLLGGVFKATGNQSPAIEPVAAKRAYGGRVMQRTAALYGLRIEFNPHFPINTIAIMRLAVAAQREGVFAAYHAAMYPAFWKRGLDLGQTEVQAEVMTKAGLDAPKLLARAADDDVKAELRATTEEAVDRGAFGAPSFFVGDELFFGVDHLPHLIAHMYDQGVTQ